jgi:hypothetical protein
MSLRSDDGLKLTNECLHQRDLALERLRFGFAHLLLAVQLRSRGLQQGVESLHQTVADEALLMGSSNDACPSLPSCGLLTFARGLCVSDQIPGHQGIFGASSPLWLGLALLFSLRFHQRLHLSAEAFQAENHQCFRNQRRLRICFSRCSSALMRAVPGEQKFGRADPSGETPASVAAHTQQGVVFFV